MPLALCDRDFSLCNETQRPRIAECNAVYEMAVRTAASSCLGLLQSRLFPNKASGAFIESNCLNFPSGVNSVADELNIARLHSAPLVSAFELLLDREVE